MLRTSNKQKINVNKSYDILIENDTKLEEYLNKTIDKSRELSQRKIRWSEKWGRSSGGSHSMVNMNRSGMLNIGRYTMDAKDVKDWQMLNNKYPTI